MLQQHDLDPIFRALADPTRRAIVDRLAERPRSVSDLAAPFQMTLTAVGQHVHALEKSGLVRTIKIGRVRTVELNREVMSAVERWFASHRERWEKRLDRLGDVLAEPEEEENEKSHREERP